MRKLEFLFASLLVITMGLGISSCSKDDDEPTIPSAKEVAGTYTGDIECFIMGNSYVTYNDLTVVIVAEDEDDVTIKLPAYGETPMTFPEITVTDVDVENLNGVYELESKGFSGTFQSGTAYTGVIGGTYTNKTLSLTISYNIGSMPTMTCIYTANKK